MRFAYADPPYIGNASKYYKHRPDFAGEVDHRALLWRLHDDFPDGWALSASMVSLWDLIPMIPREWKCRVAAWCKPYVGTHGAIRNGTVQFSWEAVLWRGGRKIPGRVRKDWLLCSNISATIGHKGTNKSMTDRPLPGRKPDEFCYWVFELLGMRPGDELADLYPGTGRVGRAWEAYQRFGLELFCG